MELVVIMIRLTQQVFIGEIEAVETIEFETIEEYIAYCEYHKERD